MSEYPERIVLIENEGTWGEYSIDDDSDFVAYCLGFDATVTEERTDEDIIAASRQAISRSWLQRSVVGSFESNPTSPLMLYYALGHSTDDAASPYTLVLKGSLELDSFSLERTLRGPDGTFTAGYDGCKVDRWELTIESESDIKQNVDWVGRGNTFPTRAWTDIAALSQPYPADPMTYCSTELTFGDSNTVRFQSFRLEVNNNLVPRYASTSTDCEPEAYAVREGGQEITGDFVVDNNFSVYIDTFIQGRVEGTLTVSYGNDSTGTIVAVMNKVAFDEFADEISARDEYEVRIPWRARPTAPGYYDAIVATWTNITGDPGVGTITDAHV